MTDAVYSPLPSRPSSGYCRATRRSLRSWASRALTALALLAIPLLFGCKKPCERDGTCIERPRTDGLDGLPPGQTVLYQPRGNPEQLLGLPIETDAEGQLVIGEARRPGCEVTTKEVPSQWSNHFTEDLGKIANFAAGREEVATLRVKYGKTLRVEARVENQTELRADLRGSCGPRVITTVLVGTGWRDVQYAKSLEGGASVNVKGIPAGGDAAKWDRVGGRFEWTQPQAWAFGVGDGASDAADIVIDMPERLTSGQEFTPKVQVQRPLWLVVLYRDAEGNYGVVFPSSQLREYQAVPGANVQLPPMVASTLPGHPRDVEKLVVYAFPEEGDFKTFRPPSGVLTPQEANAYVADLERRLADPNVIPRARWLTTSFGYEIVATP